MKIFQKVLFVLLLISQTSANSQIVGGDVFLQGCYIEVGVSKCGVYGTNSLPPATGPFGPYHDNVPSWASLGFVADHEKDGWDVGSPGEPDYCGDYFVPGTPVEGWAVQHGGSRWINTDVGCTSYNIPGGITGYTDSGGYKSATWEGTISSIDLDITQTTIFPDGALYFLTNIEMCNTGATDLTDVYYMRNVDPDQDQPQPGCGVFTTTNTIESVGGGLGDTALVTSVGSACGCFLGMGAIDPNARVSFGAFFTTDGYPDDSWNGTAPYTATGSTWCDCATQISFKVDIPAGGCTTVSFAYILDQQDLDEALLATYLGSIGVTADSVLIDTTGAVQLCKGDSVTLEILYGEDYEWTWTPAEGLSTDTGVIVQAFPDTTTAYTIIGVGECATITKTITVDVYNMVGFADAGPDVSLCRGDTAILLAAGGGTYYSWSPPVYLSDPNIQTPLVQAPLTDMFYQLIVKNDLGCSDTDEVGVFLFEDPIIDAGEDQYMAEGGFAELSASGGVSYAWTPIDFLTDPLAQTTNAFPEDTTTYYVVGTDINGCENIDSVIVFVLAQTLVASPTAFTPNGDGLNDTYKPVLIGIGEITGFEIYSRWGELLYETADPTIGWNGTFKSLNQEIGNYVVVIHALDGFGEPFTKTSLVLLMR